MSNAAKLKKRAAEFEQKKQYDKALALYVQVLQDADGAEDDADVPLFNRVGDLLLRLGNVNEALTYFEKAIDLYAERGFLNNAIALCNRVLRQSPSRASVYYKLGRISAAKGFKSDAKKNFLEYADRMQRSGQLDEAFRALKEFADLCPDQDDIRLMLAEQLSKEGRKDEALQQLQVLHSRLETEGRDTEARATVDRMKAIDPEFVPTARSGPVRQKGGDLVFLDLGDNGSAGNEPPATRQVSDPDMVAYQTSARASSARAADAPPADAPASELELVLPDELELAGEIAPLELEPTALDVNESGSNGDDQALAPLDLEPTSLDAGAEPIDVEPALLDLEAPPPNAESFLESGFEPVDIEPTSLSSSTDRSGEMPVIEFETFVDAEPDDLADQVAPDENDMTTADLPVSDGLSTDTDPDGNLPIEPVSPAQIEPTVPSADRGYSSGGAESLSFDDELLNLDGRPIAGTPSDLERSTSLDPDVSFPLDDFSESVTPPEVAAGDVSPLDTGGFPSISDAESDAELDSDVSVEDLAEAAAALVTPSASPRVDEELLAELEARLEASPGDWSLRRVYAEALLERGERESGLAELESAMTGLELEGQFDEASTLMEELLELTPTSVRLHQRRVEFAVRSGNRGQLVRAYVQLADALFRSGEPDKAGVVYQRVIELAPDDVRARDGLIATGLTLDEPDPSPESVARPAIPEPHWSTPVATPTADRESAPVGGDFVDLGDLLRSEEAPRTTRMVTAEKAPSGDEQADFDEMLRRFKQGISDNVDEEDFESHYDLGVAYKEMGLVDEAIAEFQKALRGPAQRLRACEALGASFVEKEQYQVAISILRRALALEEGDDHRLIGVLYLLGQSCEALERTPDALGFYQRVFAVDIEFRDVADRIAALDRIPT